jgi:signal transduction histidine kinase
LILRIADDGHGFAIDGDDGGGQGLRSMRRRASAVGGELSLDSGPGQGTTVNLAIPLSRAEQN